MKFVEAENHWYKTTQLAPCFEAVVAVRFGGGELQYIKKEFDSEVKAKSWLEDEKWRNYTPKPKKLKGTPMWSIEFARITKNMIQTVWLGFPDNTAKESLDSAAL